jgi:hypothetical protein
MLVCWVSINNANTIRFLPGIPTYATATCVTNAITLQMYGKKNPWLAEYMNLLDVRPKHNYHTTQRPNNQSRKNTLPSHYLSLNLLIHFSSLNNSLSDLEEPSSTPISRCNIQSTPSLLSP